MPDIHGTREELVAMIVDKLQEIERLKCALIKLQQDYENVCSANADMGDYIASHPIGD
jgi:hypothetical protein